MSEAHHVSELLFGRACRLPLLIWIRNHPRGRIFQSEPPDGVGARTAVRQELDRLTRLGLLRRETDESDPRVYYARTDHDLWEVVAAAEAALSDDPP